MIILKYDCRCLWSVQCIAPQFILLYPLRTVSKSMTDPSNSSTCIWKYKSAVYQRINCANQKDEYVQVWPFSRKPPSVCETWPWSPQSAAPSSCRSSWSPSSSPSTRLLCPSPNLQPGIHSLSVLCQQSFSSRPNSRRGWVYFEFDSFFEEFQFVREGVKWWGTVTLYPEVDHSVSLHIWRNDCLESLQSKTALTNEITPRKSHHDHGHDHHYLV